MQRRGEAQREHRSGGIGGVRAQQLPRETAALDVERRLSEQILVQRRAERATAGGVAAQLMRDRRSRLAVARRTRASVAGIGRLWVRLRHALALRIKSGGPGSQTSRTPRSLFDRLLDWTTAGRALARSLCLLMSLRPLLSNLTDVPDGATLARDGGRAFVSASLRPYVLAALADEDPSRATLVVAGDDRQARDLAGDLRAWLHPRPVRFYPTRGVAYESHLTPPPHLVGLRVAALDALLDAGTDESAGGEAPVVVVSAVALSEKVPDPSLRPHSFHLRVGDLLDLDECMRDLVAAGYERVDQVDDRGQFAARGGLLDIYPATEERAVRVDMFDIEIESLRWFSTFTQRSLGEATEVEIAPAAELALEHRELAEIAALDLAGNGSGDGGAPQDRPDISELLPVDRFGAFLDLAPDAAVLIAAEEELGPALADHWQDVCAAFHDDDAHHLYVAPDAISAALDARASVRLSSMDAGQPLEFRAQAPDLAARSLKEAEPELEKLVRSGYRTVVAWPQRGEGERARYNLGRLKASWLGEGDPPGRAKDENPLRFAHVRLRDGFIAAGLKLAILPEHRLFRRRRQERTGGRDHAARRRGALRSFADLRTGDIVVHEDHGIARFAGFETKTVAGVTRDYLYLEYQGDDKRLRPLRPAREDQPLRRRRRQPSAAEQARRQELGAHEDARAPRRAGARRRTAEPLRRAPPAHGPRLPAGLRLAARVRGRVAVHRDRRPARGDRARQGRHGVRAPDGPADLRRRRLRQDRGRAAGGVQGGRRRQAGADARADDDPRPAALRDVRRAAEGLSVHDRARQPLSLDGRPEEGDRGLSKRRRRHPHRHAPAAEPRRAREGPRADHRRRGAALRRQAEGAAAPAQAARRRHLDERDADPAHAADVARGPARHLRHRDAAGGPPAGQDVRRRVRRGARQTGARARARARRAGVLLAQPRRVDRRDGRAPARPVPRACASSSPTGRWRTQSSRSGC